MTIRFTSPIASYLLEDPEVVESECGLALRGPYRQEGGAEITMAMGFFPVESCVRIERVS